jgi:hypothetical protein
VTTFEEIGRLRLVAQRLAGPRAATPADAVRRLTAVQGQDFPGAVTSVALRTAERGRAQVLAAMDQGSVVRSWPMRGTLHLVAAEDLPWLLDLLTPRVRVSFAGRRAALGITDADARRARDVVTGALSGGGRMRRTELLRAIAEGGVATTGQRGYHLLAFLATTGTLCLGPTDGAGEQLFVLLEEWIPNPRRPVGDEALGELALRYFTGHGPATVPDLARWAGLPLRDVRAGLDIAREHLAAVDVDGVEHLMDPATPDRLAACRRDATGLFLLPGFDEFVLGYGDRRAVLDPAFAEQIVPGGNGMFRPTVVHAGRIIGTWRWTGRGAKRTATAAPFTEFPGDVAAAFPRAADALP